MNIRTAIIKAKNYTIGAQLKIFFYKTGLKAIFFVEKIRITLNPPVLDKKNNPININALSTLELMFCKYYQLCLTDKERILTKASEILNNKITLFGSIFNIGNTDWLCDPISGKQWNKTVFFSDAKFEEEGLGDVKYVMEYNKMNHLVVLAQAYYVSSDERFVEAIDEALNNWVKCVQYERSIINKIIMDIAFRSINLLQICLLCIQNSLFASKTLPLILCILNISESQMRRFSTPKWYKTGNGANHTIGEMVGLITTQLFLMHFNMHRQFDKAIENEFRYLNKALQNTVSDEGIYLEQSANYTRLVSEFLLILDIFIDAFGKTKNYNAVYLKLLLNYIDRIAYNGELPNFGDNDNAKVVIPFHDDSENVKYLLNYFKIKELQTEYTRAGNGVVCNQGGQWAWKSDDANKVFLFTRVGSYSFFGVGTGIHSHSDMLALIVYAKGNPIFIDRGTYLYNSGLTIRNNDRGVEAHNTISFDNIEQAEFLNNWAYKSYPNSKILASEGDEKSCFFEGLVSYGGIKHSRTIVYENSMIHILDNVSYNGTKINAQQNFLLSEQVIPDLTNNNEIKLYNRHHILATMQFDKNIHLEIIDADYFPSYGEVRKTKKIIARFNFFKTSLLQTNISF